MFLIDYVPLLVRYFCKKLVMLLCFIKQLKSLVIAAVRFYTWLEWLSVILLICCKVVC